MWFAGLHTWLVLPSFARFECHLFALAGAPNNAIYYDFTSPYNTSHVRPITNIWCECALDAIKPKCIPLASCKSAHLWSMFELGFHLKALNCVLHWVECYLLFELQLLYSCFRYTFELEVILPSSVQLHLTSHTTWPLLHHYRLTVKEWIKKQLKNYDCNCQTDIQSLRRPLSFLAEVRKSCRLLQFYDRRFWFSFKTSSITFWDVGGSVT